jgi:Fe-S-cluster containining protein
VPLTIRDALAHAERFPLAMVLTTVRAGGKSYAWMRRLGTTVELRKGKPFVLRVSPTAYIPPSLSCPALLDSGLCGIHDIKPARCRAMPFSPYHDETDQAQLLVPKPGWACDTSSAAPLVYRDGRILVRDDYEHELKAIEEEASQLRAYTNWMINTVPEVAQRLGKITSNPAGGHVVLDFATLLARLPTVDPRDFAARQLPVLRDFAARTAGAPALADYRRLYEQSAESLKRFL